MRIFDFGAIIWLNPLNWEFTAGPLCYVSSVLPS